MVWCTAMSETNKEGVLYTIQQAAAEDYQLDFRGRVWLVLNEPDDLNQCGQYPVGSSPQVRGAPEATADYYITVYNTIKGADPNAKVFAGGLTWLNSAGTRDWWTRFVTRVRNSNPGQPLKMDGVHVHLYPGIANAPAWPTTSTGRVLILCTTQDCVTQLSNEAIAAANKWYSERHVDLGLGSLPIWITETGFLNCSDSAATQNLNQVYTEVMKPIQDWFKGTGNPGYDAISWFTTYRHDAGPDKDCKYSRTDLLTQPGETGSPTLLGTKWNEWQP